MDEFDYEIIKSLYEEKVITTVAKNLYTSQPALTKRLKKIENDFGTTLFIRTKKGISFTENGLYLYEYCKKNLENKDELLQQLNDNKKVSITLKIGCSSAYALYELPEILNDFRKKFKNVEFLIDSKQSYENYLDLQNKNLDIAILRENYDWDGKKIKLMDEPVCLAYNKKVKISELNNLPLIDYASSPSLEKKMEKWLEENNISKDIALLKTNNIESAAKLVQNGVGWSILSSICLKNFEGYTEKLTLNNAEYTRSTYLYYSPNCENSIVSTQFIKYLLSHYENKIKS